MAISLIGPRLQAEITTTTTIVIPDKFNQYAARAEN